MRRNFRGVARNFVFGLVSAAALSVAAAEAVAQEKAIASRMEDVDGVRLHYLTVGGRQAEEKMAR